MLILSSQQSQAQEYLIHHIKDAMCKKMDNYRQVGGSIEPERLGVQPFSKGGKANSANILTLPFTLFS